MEQLIAVLLGIVAGTVTGVIPGIGVLVAMVVCTPLLLSMDIISLLLFYMSLASMVQFTGTVPSVYLGVPGETNSLPAVIEGTKHTKKGIASAWDFSDEACSGKIVGLLTHGQVRRDKDDMHPQQNLIDMLLSL